MASALVLDTGPLGKIIHPSAALDTVTKFNLLVKSGRTLVLPEIADYEIRRSLILIDSKASIRKLDELADKIYYLPVNTAHMRTASELWAYCRKNHRPNCDEQKLDCDVIISAQAKAVDGKVVTANPKNFALIFEKDVVRWDDIGNVEF